MPTAISLHTCMILFITTLTDQQFQCYRLLEWRIFRNAWSTSFSDKCEGT